MPLSPGRSWHPHQSVRKVPDARFATREKTVCSFAPVHANRSLDDALGLVPQIAQHISYPLFVGEAQVDLERFRVRSELELARRIPDVVQHAPDALWHERAVARVERRPGASVLYQTGNLKRRPERSLPAKKVLGTRKLDGVESVVMLRHKARFSSQEHPTEKVRQGDKHGN